MKKKTIFLIIANIILIGVGVLYLQHLFSQRSRPFSWTDLRFVQQITIKKNQQTLCSLEQLPNTRAWNVIFNDISWPVNSTTLTLFLKNVSQEFSSHVASDEAYHFPYSIILHSSSKQAPLSEKILKLPTILNISPENATSDTALDPVIQSFLSPYIIPSHTIQQDFFKITYQHRHFIFTQKRHQWQLEISALQLPVDHAKATQLLEKLTQLTFKSASFSYKDIPDPTYGITLYGPLCCEHIFLKKESDQQAWAQNTKTDLLFHISPKDFQSIASLIDDLLHVKLFNFKKPSSIEFFLPASQERFSFSQQTSINDNWQLTYHHADELKIVPITSSYMQDLFAFLSATSAEDITFFQENAAPELTITFNSPNTTYHITKKDDRLWIQPADESVAFEIKSSFIPVLFHIIRSHLLEPGHVL